MANDARRVSILDIQLREAGIPFTGISVQDVNAVPPDVTIHYLLQATPLQIALGQSLLAAFDWRARQPLTRAGVVAGLNALNQTQRDEFIKQAVAQWLTYDPATAAAISAATGIPLPVDEVAP